MSFLRRYYWQLFYFNSYFHSSFSLMKHWLRQYEAFATQIWSEAHFSFSMCRKARFIAEGDFIFHAPQGALHFRHKEKSRCNSICFFLCGGKGGIRTLERVLAVTRFPVVRLRPAQPPFRVRSLNRSAIISHQNSKCNTFFEFFWINFWFFEKLFSFCLYYTLLRYILKQSLRKIFFYGKFKYMI